MEAQLYYTQVLQFALWITQCSVSLHVRRSTNCLKKKNEKDIGVHVSDNLKFSFHISNVVKKAECLMGIFKKFIASRDKVVFIRLYKQLIRPHLEYATCVWNPHFKRDIRMLEQVQRRATKCVQLYMAFIIFLMRNVSKF